MLSIIVPVLNEAPQIRSFLRHLRERAGLVEIVVVDGGSCDSSVSLATGYCDKLLSVRCGRPAQMNAGAYAASGDILWFVHVDCEIPRGAVEALTRSINEQGNVGGCFRVKILDPGLIYRVHDSWAHWIGRALRVRCGDHGIFCKRSAFARVRGYREVPLMEDVEFVRDIHGLGKFAWLPDRIFLSKRRHQQVGPYWYTLVCSTIVGLYCLGVGSQLLARIYRLMVPDRDNGAKLLSPVESSLFAEFRESAELTNHPV